MAHKFFSSFIYSKLRHTVKAIRTKSFYIYVFKALLQSIMCLVYVCRYLFIYVVRYYLLDIY